MELNQHQLMSFQLSSAMTGGPNPEREGIDVWFVILEVARPTRAPSTAASVISSHNLVRTVHVLKWE